VLLVGADHPHDAAAADDLALVANLLDRCPDFHQPFLFFTPSPRHLQSALFTGALFTGALFTGALFTA
jgi:hypothetical protein